MTKQHYALVEKEGCYPLKIVAHEQPQPAEPTPPTGTGNADAVRRELEQIYRNYADLYPNPKLIEENRQRDTLLQAARAASTAQQQQANATVGSSKRKGFFTFLFGSREDPGTERSPPTGSRNASDNNNNNNNNDDDDDTRLQYIDIPNEHDDGSLCGTLQSLDVECIPPEAYTVARSHLASTRAKRDNPNALRWGPHSRLLTQPPPPRDPSELEHSPSLVFLVVGPGEIAEFGGGADPDGSSSSLILPTSDREELLAYAGGSLDLSAVRGTVVSPNCIVVSWGFADGISVVYRRRVVLSREDMNHYAEEWEAVWWLGPSGPVLDNMTSNARDLFLEDDDQPASPLLKVSDLVALHVEAPVLPEEEESPPGNTAKPLVATLAISRLGGYIELVPLPTPLWNGPVLQRDIADVAKRSRRKPNQPPLHYAAGRRIVSPPSTLALATLDYHLDVQALEVHRTSVNSETEWNSELYPEGPPAEFLLVASGMSVNGGFGETMTFWAVSTIFSSTGEQDFSFQIHSSLVEAIWTDTGAPVSVFASPAIMSQWRTPRQVELKDTARDGSETNKENNNDDDDETLPVKPLAPVTTLSTAAPIVSMKFSGADGSSGPYLSVLDWNGAVQIFDCSVVARLASQDLTEHEYEQYHNMHAESEQEPPIVPFRLVSSIVLRNQVTAALQKTLKSTAVGNLHWLESAALGNNGTMPSIVFLLSHSRKLAVVTFELQEDGAATQIYEQEAPKFSVITVPFPSSGAAVETFHDDSLSFVSVRTGRSKSSPQTVTRLLKYFVMEQLQPVAIVEALARESKFREAIESASKLSKYEQNELGEVVVGCHQSLWETKRDVQSLSSTNDDSYIVREAAALCDSDKTEHGLSFEDLRLVLKLALETSSTDNEEKKARARTTFVRLGTYEILCEYYGSKPSLDRFRNEFLQLDLANLSHQLAGRGDISALSIVLFRHRSEIRESILSILGSLPLALNSASFCHLLPVLRKANVSDLFLDSSIQNGNGSELPWSHMPQFLLERSQISIVVDRFDEIVVLEYNKKLNESVDSGGISETMLTDLLVKRAKTMQAFVGDVDEVVRLGEFGIKCLNGNDLNSASPAVRELHAMRRTASSLQRMLLDQAVSINGDGIDTDDLMGMDLVDLLDLVLDARDHPSVVRYRFQQYVQPLVMEMHFPSSNDTLDEALVSYCLREAQKCSDLHLAGAKHALTSAVAVAESSKVSLKKEDRLIKNEERLIYMVLTVAKDITKNLTTADGSFGERRELIESIWNLYETLPARLIAPKPECEAKLQAFYQDLVGVDILSRWPGCKPFEFFNKRQEVAEFGESKSDVNDICKSFVATLSMIARPRNQTALFQDLLCDIGNFNEKVLGNTLDIPTILSDHLVPMFLDKGHFGLVASYLGSDKNVMDRRQVSRYVIEYLDETIRSEDGSSIISAMDCQDVLQPLLPEIEALCQSNRRYLDASHFVSNVLFEGNSEIPLRPSDLKEMASLDAIETVLREKPDCIVCRCSQWSDFDYAKNANKQLRDVTDSTSMMMDQQRNIELPELPGGAVFHLATILGLESIVSAVVVKSRVIHYALHCEFHGAGAAIARTLVLDKDFGSGENPALDAVKLDAIANVVSDAKYMDQATKKELCTAVLCRSKNEIALRNSEAFHTILQVFSDLDHISSRFEHEMCDLPPKRKESLLSRPIARLHVHTFHEYKRDMHCLFKDLSSQADQGLVHDSLMDALSRFMFYWCIHDSKTTKSFIDLRYKADAKDNLMLGCALILQIPSNLTAVNSVHELQEIAVAQALTVATEERFEALDATILPDPGIMKHLMDRGFSDNGARRAVTMTGNAGCREALAWAVEHTMDSDFNDPLIRLKPSNSKFIDEGYIQLLQKSLIQLSNILDNPISRSAFLRFLGNHFSSQSESSDFPHSSGAKTTDLLTNANVENFENSTAKSMKLQTQQKPGEIVPNPPIHNQSPGESGSTPVKNNRSVGLKRLPAPPPPRGPSSTTTSSVPKPIKTPLVDDSPTPNGTNSIASGASTKIARKPMNEREVVRSKAKMTLNKLQSRTSTTANGVGSGIAGAEAKARTKPAVNQREEVVKKGIATQKTEHMTSNKGDNNYTKIKPAVNRREEVVKKVKATHETEQMASNKGDNYDTKTKPAVNRRDEVVKKGQATQKIEKMTSNKGVNNDARKKAAFNRGEELAKKGHATQKTDNIDSCAEKGSSNGIVGAEAKARTKPAVNREEEVMKKGEVTQKTEQMTSKKEGNNDSSAKNGSSSGIAVAEAKDRTKPVVNPRKEVVFQTTQKAEHMTSNKEDNNDSSAKIDCSSGVTNGGAKTEMKTPKDRREALLKRAQAARKREQMASNKVNNFDSTKQQQVSSTSYNLGTKTVSKTSTERREELLRKGQAARKREQLASNKVNSGESTADHGVERNVAGMRTSIATKSAMDRREELLKKAQAALGKRRTTTPRESGSRTRLVQEGRQLLRQSTPTAPTTRSRPTMHSKLSVSSSQSAPKPTVAVQQQEQNENAQSQQPPVTIPSSKKNSGLVASSATPTVAVANGSNNEKVAKIELNESDDTGWGFDDFDDF